MEIRTIWERPIISKGNPAPLKEDFLNLFHNKIPYIEIKNFLSPEICKSLVRETHALGLKEYDYSSGHPEIPKAKHIFESHYKFEDKSPKDYFPVARTSIEKYLSFCQASGVNPAETVRAFLSERLKENVLYATQETQPYTYAMIRELKSSALLHADYASFLDPVWSISQISAEYAWNIYLTDPGKGGECIVYNLPWEKTHDSKMITGTYGYSMDLVTDCESCAVPISPGSLVFFNSRNFHKVNESEDLRISIGGHVGQTSDNQYWMWV